MRAYCIHAVGMQLSYVIHPAVYSRGHGRSLAARLPAVFAEMATCTWPTILPSFSIAMACRSHLQSHNRDDLSILIRGRGGGLTARRKRKSSLVHPPPSFS